MSEYKSWPLDIRTIEIMHTILAMWCAKCLLFPADAFVRNAKAYYYLKMLEGNEHFWGWIVSFAAVCELLGLILLFTSDRLTTTAWTLRVIGLSIGSMFFALVGVSWTFGSPDSIPGPFMLFAAARGWYLLYLKLQRA
jgi:hypothetical protein